MDEKVRCQLKSLVTCQLALLALFWSLCPVVLLAMAFVGPLQKRYDVRPVAVLCALCQVEDSSEED